VRRDPFADLKPLVARVYAYVAWRIGEGPEAEDVTSEVFERAIRYRDRYDASKGAPEAWLIGIARRCIVDAHASQAAARGSIDDEHGDGVDLEGELVGRLTLQSAIANLGDRDRELIALRYGADLSGRQIAELLEMKTNAVDVALHRALARLRELLEPEGRRNDEGEGILPSPIVGDLERT
jgi:RNA polymerase sigma-70 factor (ECF subfamily)